MYADQICIDSRDGVVDHPATFECISLEQIISALKKLDGHKHTQVTLSSKQGPSSMCVAGGNDGRYVAHIAINVDEKFFILEEESTTDGEMKGEVKVVTGGQAGMFPASQCVSFDTAVRSAVYFGQHGQPNPKEKWHEE